MAASKSRPLPPPVSLPEDGSHTHTLTQPELIIASATANTPQNRR